MYSGADTLHLNDSIVINAQIALRVFKNDTVFKAIKVKGGFPHSDTPGSKLVCQLPEAFRRLPRPSSPPAA